MSNTYKITLTGANPLLMHSHDIQWQETMQEWQKDPANRSVSVAGDDRTPAFRWLGCFYHENGVVIIPSDNLMTMLREGGAKCPTGKRGGTYKRQTQSGLIVDQTGWPVCLADGKPVSFTKIKTLMAEKDFPTHQKFAEGMGFKCFAKPVKIGQSKHIRVRPRFDVWSCSGTITVLDETITKRVLQDILTFGGRYAGLGDWRPSSPKSPGSYGTFTATVD
jgi:hypothetical protein